MMRTATPAEQAVLAGIRAERDVALFARHAVGHHLRLRFAPFHRTLFGWHREMGREPLPGRVGRRFVLAAPRGNAKSTIVSLVLVLHDAAYRRERYIVLVSATQRQAQQRLRALRQELLPGAPLARWMPGLAVGRRTRTTARVLEVNGVRIEAFGAGAEMRGISTDSWRPTKIVLDDAESSAAAESPRRRLALHDWFREVVEHLGGPYTHLLAIGTVLHRESLLATLLARPDFEALRLRAIERFPPATPHWEQWRRLLTDMAVPHRREQARAYFLAHRAEMEKGARVLWPEHEDAEHLMAQLVLQGRRAFYQEKQNEPLGPEDALFEPARAWRVRRERNGELALLPPSAVGERRPVAAYNPRELVLAGYLDSALGKQRAAGRGDFAALATVARAPDGRLLVLALWVKRAPPSEQVAVLFESHACRPFHRLGIEGTGFQELLTLPIEEERKRRRQQGLPYDVPVEVVMPRRSKDARIAALEPLLTGGQLALSEELPEEFWTELAAYPRCEHDDALDAVAGAVELARQASARLDPPGRVTPQRRRANSLF
ncbi:MAG: hypothetical protein PWP23_3353 [Candidatus Sumerlaeota bacterium]|nr:hypothetical protein [Candidatus Sumerlaeota bacterium]